MLQALGRQNIRRKMKRGRAYRTSVSGLEQRVVLSATLDSATLLGTLSSTPITLKDAIGTPTEVDLYGFDV